MYYFHFLRLSVNTCTLLTVTKYISLILVSWGIHVMGLYGHKLPWNGMGQKKVSNGEPWIYA